MKQKERLKWFNEARLGMFIHWGIYAVPGRGEWVKYLEKMTDEEYGQYAHHFKAENYDPEEWVLTAKQCGMNYMILTSKHHDGYCLFDTKTTNFNSVKTGPKRDLVKNYVDACRKHDMRIGLYFSLPDWSQKSFMQGPDVDSEAWHEFNQYTFIQLRELLTNYGKIDLLWYDQMIPDSWTRKATPEDYRAEEMNNMVMELQPEIIINDRSLLPGDFHTSEQSSKAPDDKERMWESCMTLNGHWGYCPQDDYWKSTKDVVRWMTAAISKNGNCLLNVGPKADGRFPDEYKTVFNELGSWINNHREFLYGVTKPGFKGGTVGLSLRKNNKIYFAVHFWFGKNLCFSDVTETIKRASILSTGQGLKIIQKGNRLFFPNAPDNLSELCPIIVLEM